MFQYLATCFVVTVKNIFSSLTTIINHIKGNYHDHVQAGRIKRLLQELQEAENTKIQYDWISEHRQETRQANKIIQRQIHLSVTYSQFEIQVQSKTPPKPSTIKKIRNCDIELKLLNIEYFQHLELETELMNRKPSGHLVHRYTNSLQDNPKQVWGIERPYCQLRGGCCARDCGCCERSWLMIWDPSGEVRYLHCAGSCGCYTRHRGNSSGVAVKRRSEI